MGGLHASPPSNWAHDVGHSLMSAGNNECSEEVKFGFVLMLQYVILCYLVLCYVILYYLMFLSAHVFYVLVIELDIVKKCV